MPNASSRREAVFRWGGLALIGAVMALVWWWFARADAARDSKSFGFGFLELLEIALVVFALGFWAEKPTATFPVLRWFGAVFLAGLVPPYWYHWGGPNFMQLCDVALLVTVLAWWTGSSLLLSASMLGVLVIHVLWCLDAGTRVLTGALGHPHFLIGGGELTSYMWMTEFPLYVRLISLFHLFWVPVLLCCIRKTGYDRRALAFQAALALFVMILTLNVAPHFTAKNVNFVFKDPVGLRKEPFKPPALHMFLTWMMTVAVLYAPGHFLLRRIFQRPGSPKAPPQESPGSKVA